MLYLEREFFEKKEVFLVFKCGWIRNSYVFSLFKLILIYLDIFIGNFKNK